MIHGRYVASSYTDMSANNIGASWTQINMTDPNGMDSPEGISHLAYRNTSGSAINIGVGITGSPTLQGVLAPNADMDSLPFKYSPGVHIFVQSASGGVVNSGKLIVNFYQTRSNL